MIGIGIGLVGGGIVNQLPFRFTVNTNNTSAGSSTSTQFKLPLVSSGTLNAVVNWGDGTSSTITTWNQAEVTHTYATAGVYDIKITGVLRGWRFNNGGDKLKILNIINWGSLIISTGETFFGCTNLTASALDAPIITSTSLNGCFDSCANFNGFVKNWNVSNVTNFGSVFNGATVFNQDISTWNVSSGTIFYYMFISATSFNQNIGSWDVSSATNMLAMFYNATAFNQNIGSWNISNVTNLSVFMGVKSAANYSAANLDAIYNGWSSRPVQPNLSIDFGSIKYTAAGQAGKDILDFAPNNWTIVDGGI